MKITVNTFLLFPCVLCMLGAKHKTFMTVEDCYELGKIAYSDVDYYHTELWMSQALKQLEQGEESNIDKVTVLDYLSYSIYQQGEIDRALDYTKQLLKLGESLHHSMKYFSNFQKYSGRHVLQCVSVWILKCLLKICCVYRIKQEIMHFFSQTCTDTRLYFGLDKIVRMRK